MLYCELNSDITANKVGTGIDLSTYSSSLFTAPSDGYVTINSTSASSGTAICGIYGAIGESSFGFSLNANGQWQGNMVFIKKGMRVKTIYLPTNFVIAFVPLTV